MSALRIDRDRLKAARLSRALTQQRLAEIADIHPVTLVRVEQGHQGARVETIRRLAVALDVDPLEIATLAEA